MLTSLLIGAALLTSAQAAPGDVTVHGDVKTFSLVTSRITPQADFRSPVAAGLSSAAPAAWPSATATSADSSASSYLTKLRAL